MDSTTEQPAAKVTIGGVLKRLRGDTAQSVVALAAGVKQTTLSDYEHDKIRPPAETARKLLDALNASDEDRRIVGALVVGPHLAGIAATDCERRAIVDELLPPEKTDGAAA